MGPSRIGQGCHHDDGLNCDEYGLLNEVIRYCRQGVRGSGFTVLRTSFLLIASLITKTPASLVDTSQLAALWRRTNGFARLRRLIIGFP